MTKTVVITGVTGYFGSRIAADCLRRGWKVIAVARRSGECTAEERVQKVLRRLDPDLFRQSFDRMAVVAADITDDKLCDIRLNATVDAVVHVAADVKNAANPAQTMATNVFGTQNVLRWTAQHAQNFVYVGTAYSSGRGPRMQPMVSVNELTSFGDFNNDYERSKSLAQIEVRNSPLNWTILRPSILTHEIDHDAVGIVEEPIGIHGWFRLARTCNDIAVRMGIPIVRIPVHPKALLDVVSAPAAARIVSTATDSIIDREGASPFCKKETLVAGVQSVSCETVIEIAHEMGLHRIHADAAEDFEPVSLPEKIYFRQGGFFVSYARQHVRFDPSRLKALFGEGGVVRDLGNVDLSFCTGLRKDTMDLDLRMKKLTQSLAPRW